MRSAGTLVDVQTLGDHDHCCWVFARPADFLEGSFASLKAGIQDGLRGIYVGAGSAATLERDIRQFEGAERLLDDGSLQVLALQEAYDPVGPADPARQLAAYSEATNLALAEGFVGVRVAADATDLIRTQEQLDAYARYEHLIDRYTADHPLSAICGYWGAEVDPEAAAQISSLHPMTVTDSAPFRFFAEAGETFALSGEIDYFHSALIEWTLQRADLAADRPGEVRIDMSDVEFIDHHGVGALARYASQHDTRIVLLQAPSTVRRIIELLHIRGVVVAEER